MCNDERLVQVVAWNETYRGIGAGAATTAATTATIINNHHNNRSSPPPPPPPPPPPLPPPLTTLTATIQWPNDDWQVVAAVEKLDFEAITAEKAELLRNDFMPTPEELSAMTERVDNGSKLAPLDSFLYKLSKVIDIVLAVFFFLFVPPPPT